MKIILAIGGAVVKTAINELKEVVENGMIDVLIHNGGSIFHDFQRATEKLEGHSYPLDDLLEDYEVLRPASELVWNWIKTGVAPEGSVTNLCKEHGVEVLIFTILGADFWQLFSSGWERFAYRTKDNFGKLCGIMKEDDFYFINCGSAVVMPEVFTKALAVAKPKNFRADVVDFIPNMYRPKTRVAKYGNYYCMSHQEFLKKWIRSYKNNMYGVGLVEEEKC